mgnify:CR=1 FL=1
MTNVKDEKFLENLNTIQNNLRRQIKLQNSFKLEDLKLVAGVDIAYWSDDGVNYGVCCIEIFDYHKKEIVDKAEYAGVVDFPYIPGYLSFREMPLILEAVKLLQSDPDIYMFDGNGYLHSRNMGIATQASFELNKPTIGIAKTYMKIDDVDFDMPENTAGAFTDIIVSNEVYGRALRTRTDVKPVFVSCGNWIDIDTAVKITMHLVEKDSRLPITTRYADLATHEARRKYKQQI